MRSRLAVLGGVLVLASLGGLWLAGRGGAGGPSTHSAAPDGWLGAFLYLEETGTEPQRREASPGPSGEEETLVVAFPWSAHGLDLAWTGVEDHLRRGGTLLVGHSGGHRPGPGEIRWLRGLDVEIGASADRPPAAPWEWWSWARRDRLLEPAEGVRGEPLATGRSRWRPAPPEGAEPWFVTEGGETAVAVWSRGRGRVVLFPAELLTNRRLREPAHRAFLESLRRAHPGPWSFDEYHHGWGEIRDAAAAGGSSREAWDRLLLQLVLIYGVAAWALAWRMGPPWPPEPEAAGGSGEFLRRLGRLHRELGHGAEAAERLLDRAKGLDPRIRISEEQRRRAATADDQQLLALAREIVTRTPTRREG